MCWSLSLSPVFVEKKREKREAWAIEKKYGHMKAEVLKKNMDT